ncbi:hypothetical protein Prudu_018876 [Prunus dulcis]|uniref:Uncharacterized protein n=1 Tax=Prunus dulcis TaxID=3755 RepID=A0A4Y1RRR6_PRUDU|nr:hypothetical protein Prudu_018876 [Prunus dulcis]
MVPIDIGFVGGVINGATCLRQALSPPASTTDTTSIDDSGASGSQPAKKNTRGSCRQLKTVKVSRVTNSRVNIGYDEWHRAAPTAELHSSLAHDIGHVALQEGCPKEFEGQKDSLEWLYSHFQAPDYVNKAKVNKGNRNKKTLLPHSGSRPFSYRMEARRRGRSKFSEIDVFGDIYMTMVERSQLVLQESASQLPPNTPLESMDPPQDAGFQIMTGTLDQTLGRRPGTYCRGMRNAQRREPRPCSSSQSNKVTTLTATVVELKGQMSVLPQSLVRSGIPIPHLVPR